MAQVKVLSVMIDQYIEEEEGELFKAAKKVRSKDEEEEISEIRTRTKIQK